MKRTVDVECFADFFLIKFREIESGQMVSFPLWPGRSLDIDGVIAMMRESELYTFNGNNYDMPMIMLALTGADTAALKAASDQIIRTNLRPWMFYQTYGLVVPEWLNHVDVMEVAPGVSISLKMYAGRMHAPTMQDLPYDPAATVAPLQRIIIDDYCGNDNAVTAMLVTNLRERLELREELSRTYRTDLRSKSDAQIAEAVIKSKLDFKPDRRYIHHGYEFQYKAPSYIQFATPQLQDLLRMIASAKFTVGDKEQIDYETELKTGVNMPEELKSRVISIGTGRYQLGIGGLHSQESNARNMTMPGLWTVSDHDVKSYYPSLILGMDMYPEQLGPAFLEIYRTIYTRRLAAKAEGRKSEDSGLKIVLNGTFGKLFNKYSILFAPELGIRVTLTGQLCLLMLIEAMEAAGISCVSANTDGIILRTPKGYEWMRDRIVKEWEQATGLEMEAKTYKGVWSRDVNNYIAIDMDGKVKRKGVFAQGTLQSPDSIAGKHPDKDICADAVVAYLKDGTPIATTVRGCTDIRKFLTVRAVRGGGRYVTREWRDAYSHWNTQFNERSKAERKLARKEKRAAREDLPELLDAKRNIAILLAAEHQYLGKAVRWYYGGGKGFIATPSLATVAGSEGATPIMKLPETLPGDISFEHYIAVAETMLDSIGCGIQL